MSPTATKSNGQAVGAASAPSNRQAVLQKCCAGTITMEEADKLLQQLEGPSHRTGGSGGLSVKVAVKGGVSVYGLSRWPLTLYVEQWERLLAFTDELKGFLKANDSLLKRKVRE